MIPPKLDHYSLSDRASPEFWAIFNTITQLCESGDITVPDQAEIMRSIRIFLHQQGCLSPTAEDCANPDNGLRQVRMQATKMMLAFFDQKYPQFVAIAQERFKEPWQYLDDLNQRLLDEEARRRQNYKDNPVDPDRDSRER
jgi:hypothetical protein